MSLLDTSIAVWLLRGHPSVVAWAQDESDFAISWVTHAELLLGAVCHSRDGNALAQVRQFIGAVSVLLPDATTCEEYASIQASLRRKGTPIPSNDVWIAALCRQHELTLVTADEHFAAVEGINLANWLT